MNATEALAYQHLKDEKGLGAIRGRKIVFVDVSHPLDDIEEGEESNSEYEMESPIPTPVEDDEGMVETDDGMRDFNQQHQLWKNQTQK